MNLMLADPETFSKVQEASAPVEIGNGLTLRIPSALHLIAMKLTPCAARIGSPMALICRM